MRLWFSSRRNEGGQLHLLRLSMLAAILALILAACNGGSSSTAGSCWLGLADGSDDATAIKAVLAAEGQLVVAQEIDGLTALWSETGYVADAKHTPEQNDDDQFWRGIDAIRHRYVRTVFPGAPSAVAPSNLDIHIDGERAEVRATTRIGDEVASAGDRWTLTRAHGCWLIESLTYNLEPATP